MRPAGFEQGVAMKEWFNAVTGSLLNSENAVQNPLVHSLWASFKRAYSALLELKRAPLLLHLSALIKTF
jgi:hypothetical protein